MTLGLGIMNIIDDEVDRAEGADDAGTPSRFRDGGPICGEDNDMKFAKIVFIGAGVWGIAVLTPLFWLIDLTGRRYAPPLDYPQFFYGFLSVAMAWQIAFLVIGSNPVRFRVLMPLGILEKLGYVLTVVILYWKARIPGLDAQAAVPDLLLCVLFVLAFAKTRSAALDARG